MGEMVPGQSGGGGVSWVELGVFLGMVLFSGKGGLERK